MLPLKRPPPPADFEATVTPLREAVQKVLLAPPPTVPAPPAPRRRGRKKSNAVEFAAAWTTWKDVLTQVQHGKCGYCEIGVIGGQPGDVDHFWPKGEVWALDDDPATWGRERPWLSTVEGRKRTVLAERGYWWKAYEWTNYVVSCTVCNQYWKLSFFPVAEDPRTLPPSEQAAERPLLLDPFDENCKPGQHLRFTDLGQVEARDGSRVGFETIRTVGLDRESLRRLRQQDAGRAYRLARELADAPEDRTEAILRDFYEMGLPQNRFAGMIRIIFEEQCRVFWSDLEAIFAQP